MPNISFGERMRRGRIKNAWTQAELAGKLGVTQVTISNWETGRVVRDRAQKNRVRAVIGLDAAASGGENGREDEGGSETEQAGPSAFGS